MTAAKIRVGMLTGRVDAIGPVVYIFEYYSNIGCSVNEEAALRRAQRVQPKRSFSR